MTGLVLALALAASPQELREEQQDVDERLETERLALQALQSGKVEVLGVIDFMERLARESQARAASLARTAMQLDVRVRAAKEAADATHEELTQRQAKLAPRVVMLYRLLKEDNLTRLVSASTFASLVKRERALSTLMKADLKQLDEVALLSRYEQRQSERLGLLQDSVNVVLSAARQEEAVSKGRRVALDDLLRTLNAEANQSSRVVKDLERADAELTQLVNEMKAQALDLGLRTRKGHLPFPTQGIVEVGFGKVVNPRFNTVTVQKGVDIRAAAGTRVLSVGMGSVVYSGWLKGYGNLVIIDHGGGYHSLYAHLENSEVDVGNELEEGEELGTVGDTGSLKGAYLYFEIRRQGDAIDPLPWLSPQE